MDNIKAKLMQEDYNFYIWNGCHKDKIFANCFEKVLYNNGYTKSKAQAAIVSIHKQVNRQLNKDYPIKFLFIHSDIDNLEAFKNCDNNFDVFALINKRGLNYSDDKGIVNVWADDPLGYYIEIEK